MPKTAAEMLLINTVARIAADLSAYLGEFQQFGTGKELDREHVINHAEAILHVVAAYDKLQPDPIGVALAAAEVQS